jgi:hypothetical protein
MHALHPKSSPMKKEEKTSSDERTRTDKSPNGNEKLKRKCGKSSLVKMAQT